MTLIICYVADYDFTAGDMLFKLNLPFLFSLFFLGGRGCCSFYHKTGPVQLLEETEKAVGDPQLPIGKSRELKNIQLVSF